MGVRVYLIYLEDTDVVAPSTRYSSFPLCIKRSGKTFPPSFSYPWRLWRPKGLMRPLGDIAGPLRYLQLRVESLLARRPRVILWRRLSNLTGSVFSRLLSTSSLWAITFSQKELIALRWLFPVSSVLIIAAGDRYSPMKPWRHHRAAVRM